MTDTPKRRPRAVADDTWRRTRLGFEQFLDVVAPWLLDLGSWIFGALIAFNLVMLGVALTIGPVDGAEKIATAAFGLALPPNVVGFVLLRLVTDMRKIRLQDMAAKAFEEAGFQRVDVPKDVALKAERRTSSVTLIYTYSLMAATVLLTLLGLTAALWHSAWWIGVGFVAMLVVSVCVLLLAVSQLGGGGDRWRGPTPAAEPPKSG